MSNLPPGLDVAAISFSMTGPMLEGAASIRSPLVTPLQFLARFTANEKQAITEAAINNGDLMLWMLTAMGASSIDLSDPQTVAGINALVAVRLLTADRATAILTP